MPFRKILGDVCKPEPAQRCVHHLIDARENELPFDPHLQFAPPFLQLHASSESRVGSRRLMQLCCVRSCGVFAGAADFR